MKKVFGLIMVLIFSSSMIGCSRNSSQQELSPTPTIMLGEHENSQLTQELENGTRIITDSVGRQVEIPNKVETIITLGSGAPRLAAYLDVMDMLVGA